MSEAVRTFTKESGHRHRGARRSRRGGCSFVILLLLAAAAAGMWWLTNDHTPLHRLIPREEPLHAAVRTPADAMPLLTETPVTTLLHQAGYLPSRKAPWPENLPEWAVRNFFGEELHVFGALEDGKSLVFATRLTRIAALAERIAALGSGVSWDWAGGLLLRKREGPPQMYYAVRGRYLLASASRRRLIDCLTLLPEESMDPAAFEAISAFEGAEQVRGLLRFDLAGTQAKYVRSASFALHAGPREVRWSTRLEWQPEWAAYLGAQLGDPPPRPLVLQSGSLASCVLDAGNPLDRVADALGPLWEFDLFAPTHFWIAADPASTGMQPSVLRALLAAAGPRAEIAWTGYDPYEIVPAPIFQGRTGVDEDNLRALLQELPDRKPTDPPDGRFYAGPTEDAAGIAMLGGSSLAPRFVLQDDTLLFSTSSSLPPSPAESTDAAAPRGHFRLRARPQACFDVAARIGSQLAAQGWLKGFDAEDFGRAAAEHAVLLRGIEEVDLVASFEGGALSASLIITTADGKPMQGSVADE